MKIVIAGAGEVGSHLAKMLSNEEQDIVIIDSDARKLVSLENYNLMTYQGNATSFRDLKSVRIGSADLFIAVTPYETTNVLACSIAKRLGTKTTVARIDNFEFLSKEHQEFFAQMGVDDLIYPEYLAAEEMRNALHRTWVRNWFELMDGELVVVGVKLRENSRIVGHHLREITHDARTFHVAAIKRNRETIIPRGDDRILANDIAYIATTHEHIDEVAEACGKVNVKVEKVLVVGGNTIAEQLALLLGKDYRIKVIEENLERCEELAARLPDTSVVHGSARDIDLLEEEGISDYDVFVALSNSSEANILGCMMAKEHGVAKTIAEVEDLQFINEAEALNIGTIINKKLLASSKIFQMMLDNDKSTSKCLALADAEVAELVVKEGSKVTKRPVKDVKWPADVTLAGLVRDGEGQLVTGDTCLRAGDHVVVFCLSGAILKIEKVFN